MGPLLSPDSSADLDDVFAVKNALRKTGHYETPDYGLTPYPDVSLFKAIAKFQTDENLKVDSVMKPSGPTLERLNVAIKEENPFGEGLSGVRGPIIRCPTCGAPHGGSHGDQCPDCANK